MAWNQPGGAGDRDPWGKRKPEPGFDIDRLLRNLRSAVRRALGMRNDVAASGAGFGGLLVIAIAFVIWLLSGLFVLQEGERGLLLRFGQKSDVVGAGLHWRWPYPIERLEKINVDKAASVTVGYRINARSGARSAMAKEALMLTQDESIADVQFAVQYKIDNAEAFFFNVRDPETTIAQVAESAMRDAVAKTPLDAILDDKRGDARGELARATQEQLQKTLDRYGLGISVVSVDKPLVLPPEEVRSAFDEVTKVAREAQTQKTEAEAYAAELLRQARATAAKQAIDAEAYKSTVVTRADGDARRFTQIAQEYVKSPVITRERLYIETMEQVMANTTKIFVDQKSGTNVIYLPLDKLMTGESSGQSAAAAEPDAASKTVVPTPRSRSEQRKGRTAP